MYVFAFRSAHNPVLRFGLALTSVLALVLGTLTAEAGLRDEMDAEAFRAMGLHKLSAEELAALEAYLDARKAPAPEANAQRQELSARPSSPASDSKPSKPAEPVAEFGQEQLPRETEQSAPTLIEARIVGEFRGWDGNTAFRLDNGQIWKQRVGGKYRSRARTNPEVIVEKGRFGYYLKLVETGRSVGVKRIR